MIPLYILNRSTKRIDQLVVRLASDYADITIAGHLDDADDLISTADVASVIVLTDSSDHDGVDVVARVKRIRELGARVVVIGDNDFPKGVVPAMAAGADAVLPRESSTRRVAEQLRLVANRSRLLRDHA